ncbi:ribose-5-phosphate isomerase [Kocuria rhizophila]|uniref:ribose-5-phosphate isomerase n=1 Tax=Kocuria rhizophila TaxID=72000 RepID=UPI001909F205|nr:ribose-5-phosphate isomerase [Kocuria rhizophila]MBK4120757.1 ribose-5-phosphate isomerase [Kocuria rhizophila]
MRVHIATDHAGLDLSHHLMQKLTEHGYEMIDHGPQEYDPADDYPAFCISAALGVREDRANGLDSLGIVLGGSGNGEQMAANKVEGIRAALVWNQDTAKLAREHNDAQVMAIGGRQHATDEALQLALAFLAEPFSGDERHVRRIAQLGEYERTGDVAGRLSAITPRPFTAN